MSTGPASSSAPDPAVPAGESLAEAEAWFLRHGLPYFVDDVRAGVVRRLARGRVVAVLVAALLLGALCGTAVALAAGAGSLGLPAGATVAALVVLGYALRALAVAPIARWALHRAFDSLGLLLPLATRALPMLLLFITFLFINTEVWQVASSLRGGVLWLAVMLFAFAAVGFLVPRLRQELDQFDDSIVAGDVVGAARGTPLEDLARELAAREDLDLPAQAQVTGLQMVNLVIVLLVAQLVQVLLLAVAVFGFFILFGAVAISEDVVVSWIGSRPTYLPGGVVSLELVRVSTFLAGFAGLYFTVTAVVDQNYRREFFSTVMRELERAVGARVVYRRLRDAGPEADRPATGG